MAALAPAEHGRHLWEACPLKPGGIVDAGRAARTDGMFLIVALIAADRMPGKTERAVIDFLIDASPAR
jgi:hypothetical protein